MDYAACLDYLREMVFRMELADEKFRKLAYERALHALSSQGTLDGFQDLAGIGSSIRQELETLVSGAWPEKIVRLRQDGPPVSVLELTRLRGVGSRMALILHRSGVSSIDQLAAAVKGGTIQDPKMISAYYNYVASGDRMPWCEADAVMTRLLPMLQAVAGVVSVLGVGSYRRRRADVRSLDVLVVVSSIGVVARVVAALPGAQQVGPDTAKLDFVFGTEKRPVVFSFCLTRGAALATLHLTGSKAFNASVRARAQEMHGVSLLDSQAKGGQDFADEADVFSWLHMPFIPPELRDHYTDFSAPVSADLVQSTDIIGDLHTHTSNSDGRCSALDMLVVAKGLGYKCVGVSDHSRGAGKGLKPESVLSYASELRAYDAGLRVLVGLELDVRITRELDCPASYLGHLDYVILATHAEPDRDVLARLAAGVDAVRAVYPRMPLVFAHPSNRLLGERRPADIDWKSFFHLCAAKNVAIEINGQGRRLDLDDSHVRVGSQYKCRFLCSSDAHSTEQLSNMDNAVVAARRGLLERSSVINTSVSRLQGWLDGRDLRKMR